MLQFGRECRKLLDWLLYVPSTHEPSVESRLEAYF